MNLNVLCIWLVLSLSSCHENVKKNQTEIKIDLITNDIFILNGDEFRISEFDSVFRRSHNLIVFKPDVKYDIRLRVTKGVKVETVQVLKDEIGKVRKNINQIIYSSEDSR